MEERRKILCPSILNLAIDHIREEIEKLDKTDMDIYHVDIMDGMFVPNFAMSVRELEMIRRITDQGQKKQIDCHMMVMEPHRYVEMMANAGADII
ncbi:MAG: ribulose phosphate epimerase, partial [Lachnospiraceae bacterium]|nr:ribulose phosphate epimerase [Lachnospiraceae bacterium]